MSQGILSAERSADHPCDASHTMPSMVQCGLALMVLIGALRTIGFARTLRVVRRSTRRVARAGDVPLETAEAVAQRVAMVAGFFPGRARCLEQSLTLYYLLRRLGMEATFRLGVQPVSFAAHAWVEYGGEPVLEGELVHTVVAFPELPV